MSVPGVDAQTLNDFASVSTFMILVSPLKANSVVTLLLIRQQPNANPWQHAKCILNDYHCEPGNVRFAISFV